MDEGISNENILNGDDEELKNNKKNTNKLLRVKNLSFNNKFNLKSQYNSSKKLSSLLKSLNKCKS